MDFARKGMSSSQPRFQSGGVMYGAIDHLTEYQVGDGTARGQKQARADKTVYRLDVKGIDHPDARRIARVPDMEAALLAAADAINSVLDLPRTYETEYDGRMYHYCTGCNACLSEGIPHEKSCAWVTVDTALAALQTKGGV